MRLLVDPDAFSAENLQAVGVGAKVGVEGGWMCGTLFVDAQFPLLRFNAAVHTINKL
jgi:hypothetical protein